MVRFLGCLLAVLLSASAHAADLPAPWVELASDGELDVRAVVAPGMPCPEVKADGTRLPADSRGKADANYPLQVCIAHTFAAARRITVDGISVPTLPANIGHIVVIGDTGCRLKDDFVQDCNDPVKWPFAQVARLAAARHPDLVIHVGDYHYRETPCPASRPGCAGSPHGDNWAVWQKDFLTLPRRCWRPLLGPCARQSRALQSRRPRLVSPARSASHCGSVCRYDSALRAEPSPASSTDL